MPEKKELLERGYFPKEITPPFTPKELSENLSLIESLLGLKSKSRYTPYSLSRLNNFRRVLAVPNPYQQIKLNECIINNWAVIENHYNKTNLSISSPKVSENNRYFSPEYDLSQIKIQRILKSTSSRYMLHTDISRYYTTIYTHSIPWAIHTKQTTKRCINDESLVGNQLDKCIRNTQDGQTLGIPIGPDTSLVISEIIGTTIDEALSNQISNLIGFRYIDDYYLYFNTKSNAEYALSVIQKILREYELEISNSKTKIYELPEPVDNNWAYNLRRFRFNEGGTLQQQSDIIDYFCLVYEYAKKNPDDFVIKYATSRIKEHYIDRRNWELYESIILKNIITDSSILPYAIQIFLSYQQVEYPLNMDRLSNTINTIILHSCKSNYIYELCWALWFCKSLEITIADNVVQLLCNMDNCLVALMVLDLYTSGLIENGLDTAKWKLYMTSDDLYSDYWLLAYEAKLKDWIKTRNDYISNDTFFSKLRDLNIEFYNPNNQLNIFDMSDPCTIDFDDEEEEDDDEGTYV